MTRIIGLVVVVAALALVSGCSFNRIAANSTAGMFGEASRVFDEESDLTFAKDAMPANLKTLEGLHKVSPENKTLLMLLARGYCSYAFAFLEDNGTPADLDRAKAFYLRGYGYGLASLPEDVRSAAAGSLEDLEKNVSRLDGDDIGRLFWTAYCLGDWVNLNKDSVAAVADLSRAELMMKQVLARDERYYNATPHIFYGVYYGARPKMLGGNPDKAKEHFDRAIQLTGGKFLLAKLFLAQFYAVPTQNEVLFDSLLKEIAEAPANLSPDDALANQLAKKRAAKLAAAKKDLF